MDVSTCYKAFLFFMRKLTKIEFIQKASKLHNNKYDYESIDYINVRTKISIICKIHGIFNQSPNSHLNGSGCPICGCKTTGDKTKTKFKEFVKKSNIIHDNKYTYYKEYYNYMHKKTKIQCKKCNNVFFQKPYKHLQGQGCKLCSKCGFNKSNWIKYCNEKNKKPIIYIIKCFNEKEIFIKIGRTTKSIKYRFSGNIPYNYKIIKTIEGDSKFIYEEEIRLHRLFKKYSYKPILNFSGETECFNIKILNKIQNDKKTIP